jgi:conjugative relaxase-like TrwC/TraI family protein
MGPTKSLVILIVVIPMLSVGKLGDGQDAYYLKLAAEDYYIGGGEPQGVWLPTAGARVLGLSDSVSKDGFHALFHGRAPDGTPLVQNAGKADRRPGYDLTFSAPKTVSVLWAMAPPDIRHAIQECQRQAVTEAIQHVELEAAFSRRGKGGSGMTRAGIVVAAFEHGTSRALDCQLHTHALVLNVATRDDGTTGSLESKPLYDHKMVTGAFYRAQLAHLLQERLGLGTVRQGTSFEIAGVPSKLCDHFSKRRQEIEKKLGEKGLETAAAAAVAALDTRQAKTAVPPRRELFDQWQRIGAQFGFTPERVHRLLHRTRLRNGPEEAIRLVDKTIDSVSARSISFDRETLLRQTLHTAVERGLHPAVIRKALDDRIQQRHDVSRMAGPQANPRFTTADATAQQKTIMQSVERMRSSAGRPVPARITNSVIGHYSKPRDPVVEELKHHVGQIARAAIRQDTRPVDRQRIARQAKFILTDDHAAAVRDITANSARINTLSRLSADDHDLVLTCARQIWQKAGYRVIGTSLSRAATTRLEQETGIESMTLKRLELRMHPTPAFQLRHHARQVFRAAQHKPTYALDRLKIDKKTVLVIDAADSLTSRQMASLIRSVEKQGGRLLLVHGPGGYHQGPSHTPFHSVCRQLNEFKSATPPRQRLTRDQAIDQLINRRTSSQDTSRRID